MTPPPLPSPPASLPNRIGISTYSFWQFKHEDLRDIEKCIDLAADMGFDGVELLHRQMTEEWPGNGYLQRLKQRAFAHGMSLCGFSTHQGFLSPDKDKRQQNIDHTINYIELAYAMGIPTMRVNTGTLGHEQGLRRPDGPPRHRAAAARAHRRGGVRLGHRRRWRSCLPQAEKCGVMLGLENHWGLGRTPEGRAADRQRGQLPLAAGDAGHGQLPGRPLRQAEELAPKAAYVQAKTYYGGGLWYTLDLDYPRSRRSSATHNYRGYISLEFEGKEDPRTGVPKSLELLRKAFA